MDSEKTKSTPIVGNYENRVKSLNEILTATERSLNKHVNHKGSHVPKLEDLTINLSNRNRIKGLKGRNSIFKRPEVPAPRTNKSAIPGYHRHPTKWTYYSLEHVAEMSDESNQQAAFAFLKELEQRKKREAKKQNKIKDKLKLMEIEAPPSSSKDNDMDCDDDDDDDDKQHGNKVTFHKPQKKDEKIVHEDAKPQFRNNKLVMPEYEFGTKKVQKKKASKSSVNSSDKSSSGSSKALKLDHLQEYDDDEE